MVAKLAHHKSADDGGNIENGDDEMEHIDFIIHHVKRFSSNPD